MSKVCSLLPVLLLHASQPVTDLFLSGTPQRPLEVLVTATAVALIVIWSGQSLVAREKPPTIREVV